MYEVRAEKILVAPVVMLAMFVPSGFAVADAALVGSKDCANSRAYAGEVSLLRGSSRVAAC